MYSKPRGEGRSLFLQRGTPNDEEGESYEGTYVEHIQSTGEGKQLLRSFEAGPLYVRYNPPKTPSELHGSLSGCVAAELDVGSFEAKPLSRAELVKQECKAAGFEGV